MRVYFFLLILLFSFSFSLCAQTTVEGRVIFEGIPPAVEKVEVKSDVPTCGNAKEVQKIKLGTNQGVGEAVVRIIGATGTLEPKKGTLDQVSCEFVPHVQVLSVGSSLTLTSRDAVLHNSHAFFEDGSTVFNIAVPIPGMEVSQKLDKAGLIKLRCDAGHTWMNAFIFVTAETFYALTDADGNFKIEDVPPGSYEMEVWQEWLGKHREPVVVKEGVSEPIVVTLKQS